MIPSEEISVGAKGEITKEQLEQMMRDLKEHD